MRIGYDVAVVGGSFGGVAAALAAARLGARVVLINPDDWVGGQLTAQGVCTPDENRWIEQGGCSSSYQALRTRIREHYRHSHRLSPAGAAQEHLNPGSCWVSRLSVEPRVAENLLRQMLAEAPALDVWDRAQAASAEVVHDRVTEVSVRRNDGSLVTVTPEFILDATDFGDLLPMLGAEHRLGAEGRDELGEPDAPEEPKPGWIQPITYPIALELCPRGEIHLVEEPPGYRDLCAVQRYHVLDGAMRGMFGALSWWEYRRVIAARNFDDAAFPNDVAMINTGSNDFRGGVVPSCEPERDSALLRQARLATLGYVRWLQTECPREDDPGSIGYPELRVRSDWFNTTDGISPAPYVRESRRICAIGTVREQDLVAADAGGALWQRGTRANARPDTVGIGHYWLDIHGGASDEPGRFLETRPYQIPLASLVPVRLRNLLPACKNIGVSHLASGAFRLHPVEWSIGEAAGALAAFCAASGVEPSDAATREGVRRRFQSVMLDLGAPLYWWGDLTPDHHVWRAAQELAIDGIWPEEAGIDFRPDDPLDAKTRQALLKWAPAGRSSELDGSRGDAARSLISRRTG